MPLLNDFGFQRLEATPMADLALVGANVDTLIVNVKGKLSSDLLTLVYVANPW